MYDYRSKSNGYFNYHRRRTTIVHVGNTPLGGSYPIRLQSMTTTATTDIEGSVEQCLAIIRAGADYVRLTTQGTREANCLRDIRQAIHQQGYFTPLIADVHFNPAVADVAATIVEGVRINPGNYVDAARTFRHIDYTDEEYATEVQRISDRLVPLINICRANHTALRIGVNHGSLSDRIMSRYGDTPEGIVESCMEFLRVCKQERFNDVVISIKASDPAIMVRSVRLLVSRMEGENMRFPLHLGVTEAGEGQDGRIKSAIGIGALLSDGLGDTIRVSLTDEPVEEVYAAFDILKAIGLKTDCPYLISCPTCGRTKIDLVGLAKQVEERLRGCKKPIKVAVMGCIVNGPGEAREADIGIAGGDGCGLIFKKGEILRKVDEKDLLDELMKEVDKL